ncbi:hypothetical protein EBR21_03200 [bacterium]|nr:hypothetical protein [bacterium]
MEKILWMGDEFPRGEKSHQMKITSEKIIKLTKNNRYRLFTALAITGVECLAFAQRGKTPTPTEPAIASASDGISGFFDANMTAPKRMVFDFPTFSIDYGISPDWTVGTNGLSVASVLNWASNPGQNSTPIVQGKIRYRIFSTDALAAALTLYAGRYSGLGGSTRNVSPAAVQKTSFYLASLNTSANFASGQWGGSFAFGMLSQNEGTKGTLSSTSSKRIVNLISFWLRPRFTDSLESDLLLTTCAKNKLTSETGTARIDVDETCFGERTTDPLLRALLSWRSSQNWLWSLGVIWYKAMSFEYGLPVFALNYSTPVFPTGDDE